MHAYLALIALLSFLLIPFFLIKYMRNPIEWKQRLGFIQIPHQYKKTIWFHAASVGEINALTPLIETFIEAYGKRHFIVISTMTTTGHERAKILAGKYSENIFPILLPLDVPFAVKKAIRKIAPDILVIAETEIWPVLIHYAHKYAAKILIINGRISHKTVKSYKRFGCIFKNTLKHIDEIGVQTEDDKHRFAELTENPVQVTGNLKYALELPEHNIDEIKKDWHLTSQFIITFGSSRPEEELLVAQMYHFLKEKNIDFQIILAPRHLQRLDEIEKLLIQNHVQFQKLSEISAKTSFLLVDKMGELTKAYAVSDIALVGGSFYDFTGHNPLEPAYFSKPIIMGQYYSSCKQSVLMLRDADAIIIADKEELPNRIMELYQNPHKRKKMGKCAKQVMEQNSGALDKTLRMIEKYL
jgi:3-deoxy-D-manno-octulosonic-acid transferase